MPAKKHLYVRCHSTNTNVSLSVALLHGTEPDRAVRVDVSSYSLVDSDYVTPRKNVKGIEEGLGCMEG